MGSIVIEENIHQLPLNPLEKERFSYFYKDPLTDLYNEYFLKSLFINHTQEHQCTSLFLVCIHHFDMYNKYHGWELGNLFLKEFASLLEELFQEDLIFRIHANDFIICTQATDVITSKQALIEDFLAKKELDADFIYHRFEKEGVHNYDEIKALFT